MRHYRDALKEIATFQKLKLNCNTIEQNVTVKRYNSAVIQFRRNGEVNFLLLHQSLY